MAGLQIKIAERLQESGLTVVDNKPSTLPFYSFGPTIETNVGNIGEVANSVLVTIDSFSDNGGMVSSKQRIGALVTALVGWIPDLSEFNQDVPCAGKIVQTQFFYDHEHSTGKNIAHGVLQVRYLVGNV